MTSVMEQRLKVDLEEGWENTIKARALVPLRDMMEAGVTTNGSMKLFSNRDFVDIYTITYNMCTQQAPFNWSTELYERHGEFLQEYLETFVLPALQGLHGQHLLEELVRRGENHLIMNKWLSQFFMYLDRFHVTYNSLPTLTETGLSKFKVTVFDEVKEDVANAVLLLINQERDGGTIDRGTIANSIELFVSMGMGRLDVYVVDFESALLQWARLYYEQKANEWLQDDSTPAYLIKTENALNDESYRVAQYLNSESEPKLLKAVEEELLARFETQLLEKEGSGCRALLRNNRTEDLARMYRLFSRVPDGIPPMAEILRQHVVDLGSDQISARQARIEAAKEKEGSDDPEFIKELLNIHDQYIDLIENYFSNDSLFQKALKRAFQEVINTDLGKFNTAHLMSSFCDRILKGKEKLSGDETDRYLERTVQLFSYLNDKDMFAEIYRNQLSKRLLNQKSESDETEKNMIGKLKLKCGSQFTAKMEGMMNDLSIGIEQGAEFDEHFKRMRTSLGLGTKEKGAEFHVHVLTTGHWPKHTYYDVNLPMTMLKCQETFQSYYVEKHNGRRLQWYHGLGSISMEGMFQNRKKCFTLKITTLQAIALMEFNDPSVEEPIEFETLAERTKLSSEVLKRVLHSLSCGKERVLSKTKIEGADRMREKQVRETDTFSFHETYSSRSRVVSIPMASLDDSHNTKRVEEDRSHAIEASIVRIMKARKTLAHEQLVAECLNQLSFFRPERKIIKKRIESLIERDFLERDSTKPSEYKYKA